MSLFSIWKATLESLISGIKGEMFSSRGVSLNTEFSGIYTSILKSDEKMPCKIHPPKDTVSSDGRSDTQFPIHSLINKNHILRLFDVTEMWLNNKLQKRGAGMESLAVNPGQKYFNVILCVRDWKWLGYYTECMMRKGFSFCGVHLKHNKGE